MGVIYSIREFKQHANELFTCFYLACMEIEGLGKRLGRDRFHSPKRKIMIGSGHPSSGKRHSSVLAAIVIRNSRKDGVFQDVLGKSLIVRLYSDWEENFRVLAAQELNVKKDKIKCDLAGDMRLIRNAIVHNNSIVHFDPKRLRVLNWMLERDVMFTVTAKMLTHFIDEVNEMNLIPVDSNHSTRGNAV